MPELTAEERFALIGPLVETADVPDLVRAGIEVWSFGYGMDDEDDGFTVIELADLWAWDEGHTWMAEEWGPFRIREQR